MNYIHILLIMGSMQLLYSAPLKEQEIPPTEDLMREHGLLNRLLLVYEALIKQIDQKQPFDRVTAQEAFKLMRSSIEEYHEQLEETYIFPLFEKANVEVDLIKTLKRQHTEGRKLTQRLITLSSLPKLTHKELYTMKKIMHAFITMYRPHEAREDTVLFPKVRSLISKKEFDKLGNLFETKEKALFGAQGFSTLIEHLRALEKKLGIYNLNMFTPDTTKSTS